MDSQDAEHDDDGWSKVSMEEEAVDAEDDLRVDYGPQRPIETEYEFLELKPLVISLSDTPTGRSDIRIGLPGQTTPACRVSRCHFTIRSNSSGDPLPTGSNIIPTPACPSYNTTWAACDQKPAKQCCWD